MSLLMNYIGRTLLGTHTNFKKCIQKYATRKRFYQNTGVVQSDNKWEVTLDHRRLKTPNGKMLVLNNELLARAIASEWDAQTETITQASMHLTALCNTALDNPGRLTVHDITSYLLEFLPTDTLLFQSDEEEELQVLQEKQWGPIHEWFEKRFGVRLELARGLQPTPLSTDARAILARHLLSYDFPSLNAIVFGVEALKSLILMLACIERRLEPKEAVLLARLEEEYQVTHWGHVPWAHELSQSELTMRVAASVLVVHCCNEKQTTTIKARVQ